MSDQANAQTRPPVSYWIVAVLSLVWNAYGGVDYTMTKLRNMEFLTAVAGSAEKAQAMLVGLDALPAWATAIWALGVWGSVAGSILLLLRSRHAVTAFIVSLAGAVLSFGYQLSTPFGAQMMNGAGLVMIAVILGAVVFFWWWSRRCLTKGWLR